MEKTNKEQIERIICGDNLIELKKLESESVDLVYIDPPFFSGKNYAIIFGDLEETRQFTDRWVKMNEGGKYTKDINVYLNWMEPRLREIYRVLKKTGSFYLHCDDNAVHYLKITCDNIFGYNKFQTQIQWQRTSAHSQSKGYGRITDYILYYNKSKKFTWNKQYTSYSKEYINKFYRNIEEGTKRLYQLGDTNSPNNKNIYKFKGIKKSWRYTPETLKKLYDEGRIVINKKGTGARYKRYLDEMNGVPLQNIWTDILPVQSRSKERLNYPTQKPEALLERIIKASSNEGDIVLDAFCYSDDTEVLVNNCKGAEFKLFEDVIYDNRYKYESPMNSSLLNKLFCNYYGYIKTDKISDIPNKDDMLEITLKNGTEILVTKKHSMRIYKENKKRQIEVLNILANDLSVGDFIPVMKDKFGVCDSSEIVSIKPKLYKDRFVYCVSISDDTDHNLILRRKGKIFIAGNCGCGTTLSVAKKLKRQFVGIDVSPTACRLMAKRINQHLQFVEGLPLTTEEISELSGWEYQNWIIREFGAINGKKGADGGIDGMYFKIPIQVKKYKAGRNDLDTFSGAMLRENVKHGVYIALSYTSTFIKEVNRLKRDNEITIDYFTSDDILSGKHREFVITQKRKNGMLW